MYRSTDRQNYATLFYGILDSSNDTFRFSNAGHNPPILMNSDKKVIRLTKGGTVLGFMEDFQFEEDSVNLKKGDTIIIYSDGIDEAFNIDDEEDGEENLLSIIKDSLSLDAEKIIENVFESVRSHVQDAPQSDDITIVVIKKT